MRWEELSQILVADELNIHTEEEAVDIIFRWIDFDPNSRKKVNIFLTLKTLKIFCV